MRKQVKKNSITAFVQKTIPWYKKGSIFAGGLLVLFIFIGILTSIQPAYRLSSSTINDWTRQIDGSSFLYIIGMENRVFKEAYPEDLKPKKLSSSAFELATNVELNDPRSLLGREIPGFAAYDSEIIVAGQGTDYTNLPVESSAPLEMVLEDREATIEEESDEARVPENKDETGNELPTTGDRDVVFVYNTHNRESFLPHLPEGTTTPFHSEVNITKVSERLKQSLEELGIGTTVDKTDITGKLDQSGMEYWQSYEASRPVVEEAMASNKDLQYIFDLHRDSQGRDITTATIDGKDYASLFFVIGSENADNEENMKLATDLHHRIEEKYPGLSRGVTSMGGSGKNGVYNQNLSENALLIEVGGVENNMDELYRSADALAEVFSEFYWDAEKVQGNP
ncbi:stage II sporulation protein P [Sediminibacillus massiliensis]|uniref:stage II sporulation protein P n=1 Tax=Sediminibacillus massiliensis TaxID=1926277 RepID=UPI0009885D6C|nr:stage II sporulation protein P [Sediminibacillus massiliensis]